MFHNQASNVRYKRYKVYGIRCKVSPRSHRMSKCISDSFSSYVPAQPITGLITLLFNTSQNCKVSRVPQICTVASGRYSASMRAEATV